MRQPRFMIAAGSSGSGKTLITCGLLQAFLNRGRKVSSFKCGPDYIDPMFHSEVLKTKSGNLDTFFTDEETTRYLFTRTAQGTDLSVIEGVMGYYDGQSTDSFTASSYELAQITRTPVVLVINCRGMSRSIAAQVKGFVEYQENSGIQGIILNQMSKNLYPQIKALVERESGVRVLGYVPKLEDCLIESRHLGLMMPHEVSSLSEKLNRLAGILEETLDLDKLLEMAGEAPEISGIAPAVRTVKGHPVIAVARDEAFCFIYQDNLRLLEEMGGRIAYFSPIHDSHLPEHTQGLLLYGGYPELFAEQLSKNESMKRDLRTRLEKGLPCMAECGGFMYLHESMENLDGVAYEMMGVLKGSAYKTNRLNRFGYIHINPLKEQMLGLDVGTIKAHEFHYFDSTNCGDAFHAAKPAKNKEWDCICGTKHIIAGFPHLYYYSNPQVPYRFLKECLQYGGTKSDSINFGTYTRVSP